jgi:Peptidase_C39 like family
MVAFMTRHVVLTVAAAAALALAAAAPSNAAQPYPVNFHAFSLAAPETQTGTAFSGSSLTLASSGLRVLRGYVDPYAHYNNDPADGSGDYEYGTWTSGAYPVAFGFNQLVSSWNAKTPPGTWIQVEMSPRMDDGHWAKWYVLGRWAYGDSDFHRTSVGGQGDADGYVAIDTFVAKDHPATAYKLQLTLYRRVGSAATPSVTRLSAVASNLTNQKNSFPSKTTMTGTAVDLGVPGYSQETHHGEYPEFDNGGEAWCSPTSTSMVVGYWDALFPGAGYAPSAAETAWVGFPDPWVDYTARYVYDYHYNGAGNWPFNTAYAAARGLVGDVTQLHNLAEAEAYIKAGVPLVASIAFTSNKLTGADIKSTNGHLAVIEGFTADGKKVIVNDPASPSNAGVRHEYDREQFERAWIPASGGIVYVIRPAGWATATIDSLLTLNNS